MLSPSSRLWFAHVPLTKRATPTLTKRTNCGMQSDAGIVWAIGSPRIRQQSVGKSTTRTRFVGYAPKTRFICQLRPVTTFASLLHKSPLKTELVKGADFMCIRELTGGIYFGRRKGVRRMATPLTIHVFTPAPKSNAFYIWRYAYARKRRNNLRW